MNDRKVDASYEVYFPHGVTIRHEVDTAGNHRLVADWALGQGGAGAWVGWHNRAEVTVPARPDHEDISRRFVGTTSFYETTETVYEWIEGQRASKGFQYG